MDSPAASAGDDIEPAVTSLKATLEDSRRQFLAMVDHVRPDLHRYCARMTGSLADGEDVVQDTLARAYYQFAELNEPPSLRPWLFKIAHNLAIDHYRREKYRESEPLDEAFDIADDRLLGPEALLAQHQAVRLAIRTFLELAPAQRACVILKDVLDHSLDEIAEQLQLSVPAVKSALHRGRAVLAERAQSTPPLPKLQGSPTLLRYTELFNAHDWDGVRAMLADDVKLDVVSKSKAAGRRVVGLYFTHYARVKDWYFAPSWLEGHEVVAVYASSEAREAKYFVDVRCKGDKIASIHDFRYVPYIMREAQLELTPPNAS
jgi:RNA polymerase sigma factor (sigma-70 family)